MGEFVRSIDIAVTIDTNKRTETRTFDVFGDYCDLEGVFSAIDSFIQQVAS